MIGPSKGILRVLYSGNRVIDVNFHIDVADLIVSSITTLVRIILPAGDYVSYLKKLVKNYLLPGGCQITTFQSNFLEIICGATK